MKKIISALAASVLTLSSIPAVSSSAVDIALIDELSISTEIISTPVIVDGTVIPVGTTAVTVNIENSTGFSSSATKLDIDESEIIVDESGKPIVTKGDVLGNSIVSSATKDGVVVVSSASASEESLDGEMFTIYLSDYSDDVIVYNVSNEAVTVPSLSNVNSVNSVYICIGDIDSDGAIDAADASDVMHATSLYTPTTTEPDLTVAIANANLSYYLPLALRAEAADSNKNNIINKRDAQNILEFYSYVMTGYSWAQAYAILSQDFNYCSEIRNV